MKVIRENLVGLFRFTGALSALIVPHRSPRRRAKKPGRQEHSKYDRLIGPSVKLIAPDESKFCPKCHVLVAQLRHTDKGTQIIQDGRVRLTFAGNITRGKDRREERGFPITCPNGHRVRIE